MAQGRSFHIGCGKVHEAHRLPGPGGHFHLLVTPTEQRRSRWRKNKGLVLFLLRSLSPKPPPSLLKWGAEGAWGKMHTSSPQRNTMPPSSCQARNSSLRRGQVAVHRGGPWAGYMALWGGVVLLFKVAANRQRKGERPLVTPHPSARPTLVLRKAPAGHNQLPGAGRSSGADLHMCQCQGALQR